MGTAALDEVTDALEACRTLGMAPDQVGRSLGHRRDAFLEMAVHPDCLSEADTRVIARSLRDAARIFHLERECRSGRWMQ